MVSRWKTVRPVGGRVSEALTCCRREIGIGLEKDELEVKRGFVDSEGVTARHARLLWHPKHVEVCSLDCQVQLRRSVVLIRSTALASGWVPCVSTGY